MKIKAIMAALAVMAVTCCLGNTGCQNTGNVASGSDSSGVMVGNLPFPGMVPVGVAVKGRDAGATVWLKAGLTGAVAGVALAKALREVGGQKNALAPVQSYVADPCMGMPPTKKMAGWLGLKLPKPVFMICRQWERVKLRDSMHGRVYELVRCVEKVLERGIQEIGKVSTTYRWITSGVLTTLVVGRSGSILESTSENWVKCAE
jgi:hypothetical protein